jgi:hypothetical protein
MSLLCLHFKISVLTKNPLSKDPKLLALPDQSISTLEYSRAVSFVVVEQHVCVQYDPRCSDCYCSAIPSTGRC